MDYAAQVDIGRKRSDKLNEDSIGTLVFDEVHRNRCRGSAGVFVVADGAGGYDGGDLASYVATTSIPDSLSDLVFQLARGETTPFDGLEVPDDIIRSQPTEQEIATEIKDAVQTAGSLITEHTADGARSSTTVTTGVYARGMLNLGWVGDSPAYVINTGEETIEKISRDHSPVSDWVLDGELDPIVSRVHPDSNSVNQLVGNMNFTTELRQLPLFGDDIVLFTSDGLVDAHKEKNRELYEEFSRSNDPEAVKAKIKDAVITDEEIKDIILNHRDDFDAAIERLINRANRAGGADNLSMILFRDPSRPTIAEAGQTDLDRTYRESASGDVPIEEDETRPLPESQ
jgi:serine/threonine protein phosphatase PrpC